MVIEWIAILKYNNNKTENEKTTITNLNFLI